MTPAGHEGRRLAPGSTPCPFCGTPIPLYVEAILARRPLACSACGAQLAVAEGASPAALATLEDWYHGMRDALHETPETGPSPAPTGDRRHRGARRRRRD